MRLFFFDVPIYRLPERCYYAQREAYVEKKLWDPVNGRALLEKFYKRHPHQKLRRQDGYEKDYGGPWNFNEVIGYIRMYFLGSQVRGELWFVDAERVGRTRRKTLLYKTDKVAPERTLPPNATNDQIFEVVLGYIESARHAFKERVVDDSLLRTVGRHVNWRGMIDAHNIGLSSRRPVSRGSSSCRRSPRR